MSQSMTIHRRIQFHAQGRRRVLRQKPRDDLAAKPDEGRVPRVARLMALAIHLAKLVDSGEVPDYSTLADIGHVSRARITQIVNLTLLAPDIQEAILFLPTIKHGPDQITERDLRPLAAEPDWKRQREMWAGLYCKTR